MVYKFRSAAFSGLAIGMSLVVLTGCTGRGIAHLLAGLAIESLTDPEAADGADGLDCWDLNANGECDDEEDSNQDEICDSLDCRGADGADGADGKDGQLGNDGADGPPGPRGDQGPPGPTTVIVVEPPDDGPPFGRGPDDHPDKPDHDN